MLETQPIIFQLGGSLVGLSPPTQPPPVVAMVQMMESQCEYYMYFPAVPITDLSDPARYRTLPRRSHLYLGETVRFLLVLRCRDGAATPTDHSPGKEGLAWGGVGRGSPENTNQTGYEWKRTQTLALLGKSLCNINIKHRRKLLINVVSHDDLWVPNDCKLTLQTHL